jgi:hypothetical protein
MRANQRIPEKTYSREKKKINNNNNDDIPPLPHIAYTFWLIVFPATCFLSAAQNVSEDVGASTF